MKIIEINYSDFIKETVTMDLLFFLISKLALKGLVMTDNAVFWS